jgi:hypothetical protein
VKSSLTPDERIGLIKKALHYAGDYDDWEDILGGLTDGRYQIFENAGGSVITQVVHRPRKNYLNCFIVGGRMPDVFDLVPAMQDYARLNDCDSIQSAGRRGWERVIPQLGWKITGTTFRKELGDAK